MLVREVMTTPAVTVTTGSSTGTAAWLMRAEQISSIPVVDDRGALIGVLDETALVDSRILASAGRAADPTPSRRVADAMTHHVVTVSSDDTIDVAIDRMRSAMLEYLPVVANDRVIGTVGRSDLIRLLPRPSRRCQTEVSAGTAHGLPGDRR